MFSASARKIIAGLMHRSKTSDANEGKNESREVVPRNLFGFGPGAAAFGVL